MKNLGLIGGKGLVSTLKLHVRAAVEFALSDMPANKPA